MWAEAEAAEGRRRNPAGVGSQAGLLSLLLARKLLLTHA